MKYGRYTVIAAVLIGMLSGNCTEAPTESAGGGGSETQNPVVVTFNGDTIRGISLPFREVHLYSGDMLEKPGQTQGIYTAVSDCTGTFIFPDMATGLYNYHSRNDSGHSAYISRIEHNGSREDTLRAEFHPEGQIYGRVYKSFDPDTVPRPDVLVGIVGTPFSTFTDERGYYSLDDIPAGVHTLVCELDIPAAILKPRPERIVDIPASSSVAIDILF